MFNTSNYSSIHLATILGAEYESSGGSFSGSYSGLFSVKLDTGRVEKNVPFMSAMYDSASGSGVIRVFRPGESVLVVKTNKNESFIIGSVLLPREAQTADLPLVGGFSRPLKTGELLIGGSSASLPSRKSYMLFDSSGGLRIKSNYNELLFDAVRGSIESTSFRKADYTESGFEKWGANSLISSGDGPTPGLWERLVRAIDSDNTQDFIYSSEGGLEGDSNLSDSSLLASKNINNQTLVTIAKDGSISISAGLDGQPSALSRMPIATAKALAKTAPVQMEFSKSGVSLMSPSISFGGGLKSSSKFFVSSSDTIISSKLIRLSSSGTLQVSSKDVIISAATTTFNGNVVVTGNLSVIGSVTGISGVRSPSSVTAPFMSIDQV